MVAQLIYYVMRTYVRIVFRFYFRKWQVAGREYLPKDAAIIYAVNHQNAFLDAMLIACATSDEPWFLTRANIFRNKFVRTFLHTFHMLPVYRFRDGIKGLRNNDVTIRTCVDKLKSKKSILLFVEGDQGMQWKLRALQKGFARIALQAQQESNWQLPLYIVPVGIQYDHHYTFRSRVLLNYGKAFAVDAAYQNMPEREVFDILMDKVQASLRPLMLDIRSEKYAEIDRYLRHHRGNQDLVEQLHADQAIADRWDTQPLLFTPKRKNFVLLAACLPLHVYAGVNNVLPYTLLRWILNKYVSVEFMGSLKMAFGMIIVPLFYLLQMITVQLVFQDWRISLGYLITLPFLSVLSVDLYKRAMRLE